MSYGPCHHHRCCGCTQPSMVEVEIHDEDMVTVQTRLLCAAHFAMVRREASRKHIPVIDLPRG